MKGKIDWLVIPTKNRPQLLERCIHSYIKNFGNYDRKVKLLISDDSGTSKCINENTSVIKRASLNTNFQISYQGLEEKKRLVEHLSRCFRHDVDVIEFALYGDVTGSFTFGRNRNFISLRTSGHGVISSDDDIVCTIYSIPGSNPNDISFQNTSLPHWFYASRNNAVESLDSKSLDILAQHEAILGADIARLEYQLGIGDGDDKISKSSSKPTNALSRNGKIILVSNGVVGDSGYSTSAGLISISDQCSMDRILKSELAYKSALNSREIARQATSVRVSNFTGFMSTSFSFESGVHLPPYFPTCRNEDGVLANLLGLFSPGTYLANIPISLIHAPDDNRTYMDSKLQIRFSELLIALMMQWKIESLNMDERPWGGVGHFLIEIGTMDAKMLSNFLHHVMKVYCINKISYLSTLLHERSYSPDYWVDDVLLQMTYLERVISSNNHFLPDDVLPGQTHEKKINRISDWLKLYGRLLDIWPSLMMESQNYYFESNGLTSTGKKVYV